ncbi:diaminopimelate decarboxylase family protein [Nesterenkonia populi]|uniref:diaminopimelate decarboxylase family protein n=1 Tax=Nesterenkonia populi TaxID=1591087 RepID=UPI0011BF4595|nr:diaminopimelate decarboxylase [Nesterenkonia populi]
MTTPPHPLAPAWLTPRESSEDLEQKLFPSDAGRTAEGELTLGGIPVSQLAAEHGTPLYVVSEADFRRRARAFREAFAEAFAPETEVDVFYAGKAFLTTHAARWAAEEGLNIDTASGGELSLALAAGIEPRRIGLHGNNKSDAEIVQALRTGVGRVIADSLDELFRISDLATGLGVTAPVMLRLTPGVHASTHEHIATAHEDQKFGLSLTPAAAEDSALTAGGAADAAVQNGGEHRGSPAWSAVQTALNLSGVELLGLHCHIGSQIFEPDGFELAARRLIGFLAAVRDAHGVELAELDLGGGHGIAYTEADTPRGPQEIAEALAGTVKTACLENGLDIPRISIEPGRAIAGPAGVTLYTAGVTKDVVVEEGLTRRYVAVDGGMGDNPRPVLYDADYSAVLASRSQEGEHALSRIVGKHCESGDIVVRNVYLPTAVGRGDILAVPATGAYCHSLSSNYNYLTRPAVVGVTGGESQVLIRRETVDTMLARDTGYAAGSR